MCARDFILHRVPKTLAQAVNGDLHRAFAELQYRGGPGHCGHLARAGQPGFERPELGRLSRGGEFLLQNLERPGNDRQRPLTIKGALRRCRGFLHKSTVAAGFLQRHGRMAAAAFFRRSPDTLIAQKVFHRAQQVVAEAPARRICTSQAAALQQAGEESVRQFPRGILLTSLAAQKGDHRRIVGGAEIAQRRAAGVIRTARLGDERPARGGEGGGIHHLAGTINCWAAAQRRRVRPQAAVGRIPPANLESA